MDAGEASLIVSDASSVCAPAVGYNGFDPGNIRHFMAASGHFELRRAVAFATLHRKEGTFGREWSYCIP